MSNAMTTLGRIEAYVRSVYGDGFDVKATIFDGLSQGKPDRIYISVCGCGLPPKSDAERIDELEATVRQLQSRIDNIRIDGYTV